MSRSDKRARHVLSLQLNAPPHTVISARISESRRSQRPTRATNQRHRPFPPKRPPEWVVMSKQHTFCDPIRGRLPFFIRTGGSRCAATPGYNLAIPSGRLFLRDKSRRNFSAKSPPIVEDDRERCGPELGCGTGSDKIRVTGDSTPEWGSQRVAGG